MHTVRDQLYTRGFSALEGALAREWVPRIREDLDVAFADAIARPGGAVPRGPQRFLPRRRGTRPVVQKPTIDGLLTAAP